MQVFLKICNRFLRTFFAAGSGVSSCLNSMNPHYQRPSLSTDPVQYWKDYAAGLIPEETALADTNRQTEYRERAHRAKGRMAAPPKRHLRAAPEPSRCFVQAMSDELMNDPRVCDGAKIAGSKLVQWAGKSDFCTTTKAALAKALGKSIRTIQRYLAELIKFGYIKQQIIRSRRSGLYIKQRLWIEAKIRPFWDRAKRSRPVFDKSRRNSGETKLSPIKNKDLNKRTKPEGNSPWHERFAFI